jgi:hypothetical protein
MGELCAAGVRSVLVDVPRGRLKVWLEGRGFVVKRELVRMATGRDGPVMVSPIVSAITALELG